MASQRTGKPAAAPEGAPAGSAAASSAAPEGAMRLQKFLARAGVASRRGSEELVAAGRVSVNGRTVTEMGTKVDARADEVAVDGVPVHLPSTGATIMLHKPAGFVTTMSDPQGRPTVADLVPADRYPGLFPIGRLDADTTGLLLFSTDGELGNGLLHPRRHVAKRYLACVEGVPAERDLARLRRGILLDDGPTLPADVRLVEGAAARRALAALDVPEPARGKARAKGPRDRAVVRVSLREGRKRQVKRMLAAIGHPVVALHRDSFGPLSLGSLPRGHWRELSPDEVAALESAARP